MLITLSTELLSIFEQDGRTTWQNIITLDKLWFYLCTNHELIWFAPGEMIYERESHMIQLPNIMIIVAWNRGEFYVLAALPNGIKFNARYYTIDILRHIM
jgi:hypothetical protein